MESSLQSARFERGAKPNNSIVRVMGLEFSNCLGLAAGIDRTGCHLPALSALNLGHIEVGTITDPHDLQIDKAGQRPGSIIGVNVGSRKSGFSEEVFADYRACVAAALHVADYIVLNFSNEVADRNPKSDGAAVVMARARLQMEEYRSSTQRHIPLLAKVNAGTSGQPLPMPRANAAKLDGFVFVGGGVARIAELRKALPDHGIVSVGGVLTENDVQARRHAGADLVQVHRAYTGGGAAHVERMRAALEHGIAHD